jgi:hypothetical protein
VSRIDQARLERLLAEFDPYHVPSMSPDSKPATAPVTQGVPQHAGAGPNNNQPW